MSTIYRSCTECGTPILDAVRDTKHLCSGRCAVRRHRRLKKESATGIPQFSAKDLRDEVAELKTSVTSLLAILKPAVLQAMQEFPEIAELAATSPKFVQDALASTQH